MKPYKYLKYLVINFTLFTVCLRGTGSHCVSIIIKTTYYGFYHKCKPRVKNSFLNSDYPFYFGEKNE